MQITLEQQISHRTTDEVEWNLTWYRVANNFKYGEN